MPKTIAALQKKKSHLAKVSLDAAEHNGETTGLDVSDKKNLALILRNLAFADATSRT